MVRGWVRMNLPDILSVEVEGVLELRWRGVFQVAVGKSRAE